MDKLSPLGEEESLFSNKDALDPDFVPPLLPFRESETREIAASLKPLLSGESGRNVVLAGKAGIGKTHAVKKAFSGLTEEGPETLAFYVNCWTNSTGKEVFESIAAQLRIQGASALSESALLKKIISRTGKRPIALCFDEIDQAKELGFLYSSLEEFPKKAIALISNSRGFLAGLDERIRSRLLPKEIHFKEYSAEETAEILAERKKYAFFENTWESKALELAGEKTYEKKDMRFGIRLLKLAGETAEKGASRLVKKEHVEKALQGM